MKRNSKGQFLKGQIKDLTGLKFNRLTVIKKAEKKGRKTFWECVCECGKEKIIRSDVLQDGTTKSCGCLKSEVDSNKAKTILKEKNRKYTETNTILYTKWRGMMSRCNNVNDKRYLNYGARGIKVCEEWLDYQNFLNWAKDKNYSGELEIDRINVNDDYKPDNCRFITRKANCNNRRSNINITHNNKTQTLMQWCEELNLNYSTINARYKRGTTDPENLFKPIRIGNYKKTPR